MDSSAERSTVSLSWSKPKSLMTPPFDYEHRSAEHEHELMSVRLVAGPERVAFYRVVAQR
jgi:hypothetical protein